MRRLLVLSLALCGSVAGSGRCSGRLECAARELVRFVDEIDRSREIPLVEGLVALERSNRTGEAAPDEGVMERCVRFLRERQLTMRVPSGRTPADEARTRRLRKIVVPLLIALKLGAGLIVSLLFAKIGLAALTGLGLGTVALTVAAMLGLENLARYQSSRVTYEIVPQVSIPYWSRSGMENYDSGYVLG